jgi:hypothetical protein
VSVGDHLITNVEATVVSVRGDPLLGQSFLSKLPAWAIDNERHALIFHPHGDIAGTQQNAPPSKTGDMLIARKAVKHLGIIYRQSGIWGVNADVDHCYDKTRTSRRPNEIEYCFVLDITAAYLDVAFFESIGRSQPADSRNKIESVRLRVNRAFDFLGYDPTERIRLISEWAESGKTAFMEFADK